MKTLCREMFLSLKCGHHAFHLGRQKEYSGRSSNSAVQLFPRGNVRDGARPVNITNSLH